MAPRSTRLFGQNYITELNASLEDPSVYRKPVFTLLEACGLTYLWGWLKEKIKAVNSSRASYSHQRLKQGILSTPEGLFIRKRVCPLDERAPALLSLLFLLLLIFLPHPLSLLLLNDRGSLPRSTLTLILEGPFLYSFKNL